MTVRAIRGAVQLDVDTPAEVSTRTAELLTEIVTRNALHPDDIAFVLLTATPDVVSSFPAAALPAAGLADVPRMCAVEMAVAGALARTVRVVVLAEGDVPRSAARHVYQRGAQALVAGPAAGAGAGAVE